MITLHKCNCNTYCLDVTRSIWLNTLKFIFQQTTTDEFVAVKADQRVVDSLKTTRVGQMLVLYQNGY